MNSQDKTTNPSPIPVAVDDSDDELPPSRGGGQADPWHGLDDFDED